MLFSPIEMVTFYFFCSGFHHQEHVAGLCTFILFYLMKYVYKFQECSSSQFQCRPFKSWRFWTKQAHQGSEYSWCLQNDWRDWKLWVSLITSVHWNMIYNTENLIIFFPSYGCGNETKDRYMAPEVFKHRRYDKKVDVFSFAMILYEVMLASVRIWDKISKHLNLVLIHNVPN